MFVLLSSFFSSLSPFFFFVPPRTQREDAERHSAGLLPPSWLHLGPMLDHHSPSWLHLGPMLDHLGSPEAPQKCFGSPKAPRAKKYQKIASVWTASWLHGDRFSRSYSITLGCPIDVPFVVNGCPKQKSVLIFHHARSDFCCHLHFLFLILEILNRV